MAPSLSTANIAARLDPRAPPECRPPPGTPGPASGGDHLPDRAGCPGTPARPAVVSCYGRCTAWRLAGPGCSGSLLCQERDRYLTLGLGSEERGGATTTRRPCQPPAAPLVLP